MMNHATPFTVGLADTDALGVAYHPYALQLAQRNLESWLASLGLPLAEIVNNHTWALPVVRVELNWHQPLELGTEGETLLTGVEPGSKSLTLTHAIQAGDQKAATVKVVHACLDRTTGQSMMLPTVLKNVLPS
ncbi:MAG: thioesterase family protein [Planctomycetota bacterium]|nr:thioesterase family protein [Planctomycetota bacterium]MEC8770936.1 thioesterase family protein [Planctomycetota bacterium]